jgi:putative heme-binding domain-containing protein
LRRSNKLLQKTSIKLALMLLGIVAGFSVSQMSLAQTVNPYESNAGAIRAGGALFRARCATCHGADAKGIEAPDLTLLWASNVTNDGLVFQTIRDGVSGSIMPSTSAPDTEIWTIVAYLKSISTVAVLENAAGDSLRGQQLFASNCSSCHRVNGEGGSLGPDLSTIGGIRDRGTLATSIRSPSALIGSNYRPVTLIDGSGQRIIGLKKSEDAFSIQVMDSDQRLRAFNKQDLQQLTEESVSLMPEWGPEELSDRDLDDLLRYLGTLRGANSN